MVVQPPPSPLSTPDPDIDAGVIEDARKRQRRHRGIAGLLIAAAVAAGALIVGFVGGGGASGAGRHAAADPSASGQATSLAAATAACNRVAQKTGDPEMTGKPVLADVRGRYTAAIYVFGIHVSVCISDGDAVAGTEGDALVLGSDAAPGADQLGIPGGGSGGLKGFSPAVNADQPLPEQLQRILQATQNPTIRARHAAVFRRLLADGVETNVYGLAGSDVTAVTFVFSDGIAVDATIQNGWYFAWWPGLDQPNSVQVTTKSGQNINSQMASPNCKPGSSGCVFAGLQPHPALPLPTRTSTAAARTSTAITATTTTPTVTTNTQPPTAP